MWALLLLPGGLAAGHTLGYRAAGAAAETAFLAAGHGYLGDLTALAVPFTVAAALRVFLAGAAGDGLPLRLAPLATLQVLLYVAVELAEHVGAGATVAASLREPSMVIGALAQVLVAVALWLGLRLVHRAGDAISTTSLRPHSPRARAPRWVIAAPSRAIPSVAGGSLSRRGPPRAPHLTPVLI